MEQLVAVARSLRQDHGFRGYIHLKTIPEAAPELVAEAGRHADRLSVNIELPTEEGLQRLAPEKRPVSIRRAMAQVRLGIAEARTERRAPRFAPAGQSTQMVIGADATPDGGILRASAALYGSYDLDRVYYSAFSPIADASRALPSAPPPLRREHRLYQADWLMRFYGFAVDEIVPAGGMLELEVDPKLAWALRHRDRFPVDVNSADRELLLRVPGMGTRSVDRLLAERRHRRLRLADVARLGPSLRKIRPFVIAADHSPHRLIDRLDLRSLCAPRQLSLL
jgi:predicted DNA-binding helix-hairpin-helix protein